MASRVHPCQLFLCSMVVLATNLPLQVAAHLVDEPLPLNFRGYAAPFGYDASDVYTEVWAEGDFAFLGSKAQGVAILDVTNVSQPAQVSTYGALLNETFHDVRVSGTVGYFSSTSSGTHLVDLSNPAEPTALSRISKLSNGHDQVSNAFVHNNLLFQVNENSSSIEYFDVGDPTSPQHLGTIETHDQQGVYDLTVADDRVYAAGIGGVNDLGATYIYQLSKADNVLNIVPLATIETGLNTTSAWPSADHTKLVVAHREVGGNIAAWDITDLSQPQLLATADATDLGISSYGPSQLEVAGNVAMVSWHQAGMQVIDLDTLDQDLTLQRIGVYGTAPGLSPLEGFVGSRSVYVADEFETLLLADSKWGLYIVDASDVVMIPGDLDGNGRLESTDLDILSVQIRSGSENSDYDLNEDGVINVDDQTHWIEQLARSVAGDSNLDGVFDSTDLVLVFQENMYEDAIIGNGTWTTGDWNGDGETDSQDMVFAFSAGHYSQASASSVPEPSTTPFLAITCFGLAIALRR